MWRRYRWWLKQIEIAEITLSERAPCEEDDEDWGKIEPGVRRKNKISLSAGKREERVHGHS